MLELIVWKANNLQSTPGYKKGCPIPCAAVVMEKPVDQVRIVLW